MNKYGVSRIHEEDTPKVRPAEKDVERRKLDLPEEKDRERLHATMKGEGKLRRRIR